MQFNNSFLKLYEELSSLLEQNSLTASIFTQQEIDNLLLDKFSLLAQACADVNNSYGYKVIEASSVILFLQKYWETRNNNLIKIARVYQKNNSGHRWGYFNDYGKSALVPNARAQERERLTQANFDIAGSFLCFNFTFYSNSVKSNTQKLEILQKAINKLGLDYTDTEIVKLNTEFENILHKDGKLGVCTKYAPGNGRYYPFAFKAFKTEDNSSEQAASELASTNELGHTSPIDSQIITANKEINANKLAELFSAKKELKIAGQEYYDICKILPKIGYEKDSWAMRLQKIVNSAIQEKYLAEKLSSFTKQSKGLFGGAPEFGADFMNKSTRTTIEAKVYATRNSMMDYISGEKTNYDTVHDADFVCCYILDEESHWQWLKKNGKSYEKIDQPDIIGDVKLDTLVMCACTQLYKENKFEFTERATRVTTNVA